MACGSRRRSRLTAAVAAAAAAALLAPAAHAADTFTTVHLAVTGTLQVEWHGDAAAGCAAAGLCDYSGTTLYRFRPNAEIDVEKFEGEYDISGVLETKGRSEARVERALAGGGTATCRDGSTDDGFTLDARRAYRDRFSLAVGTNITPSPIVNGSCAGPRLEEVAKSLPTVAFRLRDLERRGVRLGLAGRFPFHAGPLTGQVVSTLGLKTTRVTKETFSGGGGGGGKTRTRPAVFAEVVFRVHDMHGGVQTDFRALDAPACEAFDACGASGVERYSLSGGRGRLLVFATVLTKDKLTLKEALARAARGGELDGFGDLRGGSGVTTDTLARPGVALCTDSYEPRLPPLVLQRRRHRARLTFGEPGFEASADAEADLLDGRCPGPTQGDVLQGTALANASFPVAALAERDLHVALGRRWPFSAAAYRGTSRTHVELDLTRVRASVTKGTVTEIKFGGGGSGGFATAGPRQRP